MSRACWPLALSAAILALLSACSSPPRSGAPSESTPAAPPPGGGRDGPPAEGPADLAQRPDPEPRVEPIRSGGPNKPYEVLGQRYTPLAADAPVVESGLASWYGRKFHGRPTASGEVYDMFASSAAHRTMPIPSYALVRNPANGREVVVRVNDRGPFHSDRVIDLSYAAALKLDLLRGTAPVDVRRLTNDDIRRGRWRVEAVQVRRSVPEDGTLAVAATGAAPAAAPASPAAPAPPPTPMAATASSASTSTSVLAAPAAPTAPTAPRVDPAAAPATAAAAAAAAAAAGDPGVASAPAPLAAAGAPGFWVQLGAFRQREGAHQLRQSLARELAWLEPWLAIFDERALFRLQAGPYPTRGEAQGAAERIRATADLQPLVVQRR